MTQLCVPVGVFVVNNSGTLGTEDCCSLQLLQSVREYTVIGVALSQLFTLSNHRRRHAENGGGLGECFGGESVVWEVSEVEV